MSFAKNAVGFYLQAEDQLSPALDTAGKRYHSFVNQLTIWNKKATTTIQKGMGELAKFIEDVETLDAKFDEAFKAPLTKKVKLMFDAKNAAAFGKNVSQAVAKVLSKTKFLITANAAGKITGLSTSLPHFAKGGTVGPPAPGTPDPGGGDDQIIAAKTGETILTTSQTSALSGLGGSVEELNAVLRKLWSNVSMFGTLNAVHLDSRAPSANQADMIRSVMPAITASVKTMMASFDPNQSDQLLANKEMLLKLADQIAHKVGPVLKGALPAENIPPTLANIERMLAQAQGIGDPAKKSGKVELAVPAPMQKSMASIGYGIGEQTEMLSRLVDDVERFAKTSLARKGATPATRSLDDAEHQLKALKSLISRADPKALDPLVSRISALDDMVESARSRVAAFAVPAVTPEIAPAPTPKVQVVTAPAQPPSVEPPTVDAVTAPSAQNFPVADQTEIMKLFLADIERLTTTTQQQKTTLPASRMLSDAELQFKRLSEFVTSASADAIDPLISRFAKLDDALASASLYVNALTRQPVNNVPLQGPKVIQAPTMVQAPAPVQPLYTVPASPTQSFFPPPLPAPVTAPAVVPPPLPPNFADELKKAIEVMEQEQKSVKDLRAGMELGVVTVKAFANAQDMLTNHQKAFDAFIQRHDYKTLRPHLEVILATQHATESLTDAVKKDQGAWKNLLEKVLGPARFLAVNKALGEVQQGLTRLASTAHEKFGGPAAERIDDFVTNFNQANKAMGLTRAELHKLKEQATADVRAFGGAFDLAEYSESFEALRATGLTDVKLIHEMALAATAFENATTTSKQTAAALFNSLHYDTKLSVKEMADLTANVAQFSKISGADADQLTSHLTENVKTLHTALANEDAATQKMMLDNLSRFGAAVISEGGDAGNELMNLISKAATGEFGALNDLSQLSRTAFSSDQLKEMLKTGEGLEQLIQGVAENSKQLAASGGFQSLSGEILPGLDTTSLARFSDRSGAMVESLKQMKTASIASGKGLDYLTDRAKANETTWQRWTKQVGNALGDLSLFGVSGVDVIDFLKEFGLQNLHATAYLLRFGAELPGVGKLLKGIGSVAGEVAGTIWETVKGWMGFSQSAATAAKEAVAMAKPFAALSDGLSSVGGVASIAAPAITTVGTASGVAAVETKTLGASIAQLGIGIGTFLTEVGTGAGAGVAGFLTGLAGGLEALGGVVATGVGALGLLAVIAIIGTLAGALWLITPALEVFAKVWDHGIDAVVSMFKSFIELDIVHMMAVGPALSLIGVGFVALALAMVTGTTALQIALPALMMLSVTLWAFSKMTNNPGGPIGAAIDALASTFAVDQAKIAQALAGVQASISFVSGLAFLALELNAAGLIANPGGLLGGLGKFFRYLLFGDPLAGIADYAKKISDTVNQMASSMANMDASSAKEVIPKLQAVASFIEAYSKLSAGMKDAAPTGGLLGLIKMFFVGDDLANLADESTQLVTTANKLVAGFRNAKFDKDLPKVATKIKSLGEFMESYAKIAKGIKAGGDFTFAGSPGAIGFWGIAKVIFMGDDFEKFAQSLPLIKGNIRALIKEFGDGTFVTELKAGMPGTKEGLALVGEFMGAATPMFEGAKKAGAAAEGLTKGWFNRLFTGRGLLTEMGDGIEELKGTLEKMIPALGAISSTMTAGVAGGIFDGIMRAVTLFDSLTHMVKGMAELSKFIETNKASLEGLSKVEPVISDAVSSISGMAGRISLSVKNGAASLTTMQTLAKQVQAMNDIVDAAGEIGVSLDKYEGSFIQTDAQRRRIVNAIGGAVTAVQEIQHNINAPVLTPDQLQQAAQVHVQGNVTADDAKSHELLALIADRILALTPGKGGGPQATNTPRGTSAASVAFGQGRIG